MGIINLYDKVTYTSTAKQPIAVEEPETVFAGKPILDDAKVITLAQYDTSTKNAVTAHRLKDYRRKSFRLALLPNVEILFDKVLEGSVYWNGLLHNESPYS